MVSLRLRRTAFPSSHGVLVAARRGGRVQHDGPIAPARRRLPVHRRSGCAVDAGARHGKESKPQGGGLPAAGEKGASCLLAPRRLLDNTRVTDVRRDVPRRAASSGVALSIAGVDVLVRSLFRILRRSAVSPTDVGRDEGKNSSRQGDLKNLPSNH